MIYLHLSALSGIFIFSFCYMKAHGRCGGLPKYRLAVLFAAAFLIRILTACLSKGFANDTACFAVWADRIFRLGPGAFYSPDVFADYPPGYLYVLWLLEGTRKAFRITYYSLPHLVLLKLPAIACDLAGGLLVFREAKTKYRETTAYFLCASYLFNPVILLNSSAWGQVDSLLALAVLCMCLFLVRGKLYPAYIALCIGVLFKPQMLLFAPVLLAGIVDSVFLEDFSIRKLLRSLFQGLTAAAFSLLLCLPFGLENVWEQYFNTVSSYPYAAVNAYNLWGLLGLNWVSQEKLFLGISCRSLGMAAIALAVGMMLLLSLRNRKNAGKYPFLSALLIISIFVFSVRMHERYLYPGLLLLLFAYIDKPSRLTWLCYGGFSIMHFYNTAHVLFFYDPYDYDRKAPVILLVSAGTLACAALLYFNTCKLYWIADSTPSRGWIFSDTFDPQNAVSCTLRRSGHASDFTGYRGMNAASCLRRGYAPRASRRESPLGKIDFLCMLTVTLLYSCFALYDLGDCQAPVNAYDMAEGQFIELVFDDRSPTALSYYIAPWHNRHFLLEGKYMTSEAWTNSMEEADDKEPADDGERGTGEEWADYGEITMSNVFTWQNLPLEADMPHIRLTLLSDQASLLELVFLDSDGNPLLPANASAYPELFDENDFYPGEKNFRSGMYFDEIYHGRTAYEYINGLTAYENTHPPLGKIFIALGILLFGMNPFGWRIMGALFGIAMVPAVYLFARRISGNTAPAALACVLYAFDFMHFTQTRIATIDVYITFFVIMMYYFMYQYSTMSFYDRPLGKTLLPLGACGICMGLGIACKWTGIFAGAGLAVIFFSVLYRRYQEYLYAKETPAHRTNGISHRYIIAHFFLHTWRTLGFCLIFFLAIPAVIYLLSYLPFRDYADRGMISALLYNQKTMFGYHSALKATHAYASFWYEWPIIKRPVWYYSRIVSLTEDGGLREGISAFGSPAVWWPGIPASLYMIFLWFKKKDKTAAFLLTGYLAQYLPWFFVTRVTFIYHYFPSVAFIVLMITYSLLQWKRKFSGRVFSGLLLLYGGTAFILFLMFYPVLAGQPVEAVYVEKYLRWFRSWVLTAASLLPSLQLPFSS